MGIIEKETAALIWNCYREIDAGEKLLSDLSALKEKYPFNKDAQKLSDIFGGRRNLQLGVPSGESCHQLFNVSPVLAESVIRSHVLNKHAELSELNERAKMELARP